MEVCNDLTVYNMILVKTFLYFRDDVTNIDLARDLVFASFSTTLKMASRIVLVQLLVLILVIFISESIKADRTSEKIYVNLNGEMPCFRRLNATHQIGCASLRGGSVGIIHYVENYSALNYILENGTNYPFVIAIRPDYFHRITLEDMKLSGKVSGVLLINPSNETFLMHNYSPDQKCPNMNYGLYRDESSCSVPWNKVGSGILYEDWGFPIFIIKEQHDIDLILECYQKFNSPNSGKEDKWPFCAAELKANMLGAKDTKTCIRRSNLVTNLQQIQMCDPLGDHNIWLTVLPTNKSNPHTNKSVIFLTAKLDAASMFDGVSPGAHSTVTGLVCLIAIAEALSKHKEDFVSKMNVMFSLLNGESFDYIGSSRMVYDMEKDNFPVPLDSDVRDQPALFKLENIAHFIEMNQLSQMGPNETIFLHFDPLSTSHESISKDNEKLKLELLKQAKHFDINMAEASPIDLPLPPASFQTFLRGLNISGVVLTDHNGSYSNKFYNSIYDTGVPLNVSFLSAIPLQERTILQIHLARIASTVATSIYTLATGRSDKSIQINYSRIHDLLICYLNSSSCPLFLQSVDPAQAKVLPEHPYPLYVSVDAHSNPITTLTLQLLAFLTGEVVVNETKKECHDHKTDQIFRHIWMKGSLNKEANSICVKTTANYSKAVSPAFSIDDYDFDSGVYSTWTESIWETTSVRIFLKPSPQWEMTVLFVGLFVCALSFLVVWFIERNSSILFGSSPGDC
uniref:Nicastrin n=1 Tax=Strigamia maritima TaxID=126957 RepID=T1JAP2_STRMM